MGWSCSWIAVRGKAPDALLSELGMRRTGAREETPESRWTAADLPGGWFLIFRSDHSQPAIFGDTILAAVSTDCELIQSSVEEHVMFCSSAYWQRGNKVWQIVHDAQKDIYDLHASGDLPTTFADIRARCIAEQDAEGGANADVDMIFEIPLQVGMALTGFRHDEDYPMEATKPFYVLHAENGATKGSTAKKPWWRIW